MIIGRARISVIKGDITKLKVDAIVNAANRKLTGGGGVDGAIHSAAGPELLRYCLTLGGCKTGEAKISPGFNLPARFVIHTVGPVYGQEDGFEASYLEDCYKNSLSLADKHKALSIAFPSISTGAYGYPVEEAAPIAIESAVEYLHAHKNTGINEIMLVSYTDADQTAYAKALSEIFPN